MIESNNRVMIVSLFTFIMLFFITRLAYIDADLPAWATLVYTPIDELYYSVPAFNLFHEGQWAPIVINGIPPDSATNGILNQVFVYLSLTLFDNNYYGLRMGAVLAQGFGLVWLGLILKDFFKSSSISGQRGLIAVLALILIVDFPFLMAGRIVEPTIFRISFQLFVFYIALVLMNKGSFKPIYAGSLGFLSSFAFFFIYLQDLYLIVTLYLSMITVRFSQYGNASGKLGRIKECMFETGYFIVGITLCLGMFIFFLDASMGKSFSTYLSELFVHQNRTSFKDSMSFFDNVLAILSAAPARWSDVLSTNIFRYNLAFLFLFLSFLPGFIQTTFRERQIINVYVSFAIVAIFLQSIVFNDFALRKGLILFPFAFIVVVDGVVRLMRGRDYISWAAILFGSAVTSYIFWKTTHEHINHIKPLTLDFVEISNVLVFGLVLLLLLVMKLWIEKKRQLGYVIAILILFPSMMLDLKYIYIDPTYRMKNMMIDLGSHIDGEVTINSLSFGFRMYNSSVPVINPYRYQYTEHGRQERKRYYEQLTAQGIAKYSVSDISAKSRYDKLGFEVVKQYPFDESSGHRIALYQYVEKKDK